MVFQDILKEIVDAVDGCFGAILMASDGIQVADYQRQSSQLDLQILAVEFCKLLKDAGDVTQRMMQGEISELMLTTKEYSTIFHPLQEGYFVVLLMERLGNLGKGRYLLQASRTKFLKEL